LNASGTADVILVLYRIVFTLQQIQSSVECYRFSRVGLTEDPNPPVVEEIRNVVDATIGASVIDENNF